MKSGTVAFVMIFCVAILIVSSVNAEKPPKPECIIFEDNVEDVDVHVYLESTGTTIIDGCCPNAGPAPEYTMTLHNICYTSVFGPTCIPEVSLDGYVFMNVLGTPGPDQRYMVKFWTWDYAAGDPIFGDYFFEIRGGDLRDKKTEGPNVTYMDGTATLWVYYDRDYNCSFSDYFSEPPRCNNPCVGVEPGCDPTSDDPNCYDPCNEEFTIENVSFVLFRDSDLSYCLGSGNIPPTASFTSTCTDLDCDFTDASTDSDGSVVSWSWGFGDGGTTLAEQHPSYSYAAAGTYTVTLTATDDGGATDDTSQPVTVTEPGGGITLTATGYKVRGRQKADLWWSNATGADVDVYRDGALIAPTDNDGFYTDNIDQVGGGSYTYHVCEVGSGTCSNVVTVNF